MKGLYLPCFLSFFALAACSQGPNQTKQPPTGDAAKIVYYQARATYFQNREPDSAVFYADLGLKLARRLNNRSLEAAMLNHLARINEQYGNIKLAVKYQQEAHTIFHTLHEQLATADASAGLGILEGKQGHFDRGMQLISEALSQYNQSRDTIRLIRAYTQLGEINELNGRFHDAMLAYSQAEQLNQDRPVSDEYLALISSIGGLHTKMGNHQRAANYYETGISKSSAAKHTKMHVALLNKAGKAYNRLGKKDKALAYHQLGLEKAQAAGLHEDEVRSLMGIAGSLQSKDAALSISHLKHALAIARAIGQQQLAADIYHSLSDIYRQQSRFEEALAALEEHHRLLDSLLNVNKGHKIAVLQSSYELAESRLRIEALELANKQRTFQRDEGMITAAGILFILLVVGGYFYKTRQLNKDLTSSNLIKDQLFSIIGHDLRNPIGGITQLLALMEEDDLSDEHRQILSEMRKQGTASLEILNALLKWGELQLKGIQIEPTRFVAQDSIHKNIAALHQQAGDKAIRICDHTPADITLYGDINHFEFVTRNLISNAIKFSKPAGTIEIAAKILPDTSQVVFSVKDEGKGISEAQQALFIKSNMALSYGTSGEKGTGIGLMLSKKFIAANQGRIWIESEEGKGTTFFFTFPAYQTF